MQERLPVADILGVKDRADVNFAEIRKYISKEAAKTDLNRAMEEWENLRLCSTEEEQEFLEKYDIRTLPVTESLIYRYGEDWSVLISCENVYEQDGQGMWIGMDEEAADVSTDDLEKVIARHCPVCIAKDGIEVMDVKGIGEFCKMLRALFESNINNEIARKNKKWMQRYVKETGWTEKMIRPRKLL